MLIFPSQETDGFTMVGDLDFSFDAVAVRKVKD
jgi:hypothetical protein